MHQMAAGEIVARIGTVENAAVRRNSDGRRSVIKNAPGRLGVLRRVYAGRGAEPTPAGSAVGRQERAGKRALIVVAAIVEAVAQGSPPLGGQIRIDGGDSRVTIDAIEQVRTGHGVDFSVGCNGRRGI